MTPVTRDPFSYLPRNSAWKTEEWQKPMWIYVVAKKAAIIRKISVSLFEVSSNPGVSMRTTLFPSRVNPSESWASAVHDSRPIPTRRFEPLARLINWRQPGELLAAVIKCTLLTDVFPLPVAPMTLWKQLG